MPVHDIILGLDINAPKSRAIVATASGEELADIDGASFSLKASDPSSLDACANHIAALATSALESAEQTQYRPKILSVSVNGARRESVQITLQQALVNQELADDVIVTDSAETAFLHAFGDETAGILLMAGSTVTAFGKGPAGITRRSGGWGLAMGDEGSSLWIGRKALSVVASAYDGREPETALTGAMLTAAQVNETDDLAGWAEEATDDVLAALAPSVIAVAMQDDLRANAIIDMAVEELVLHVRALARQLFTDERAAITVALAGSLLEKGMLVRKRVERRLKHAVPGASVRTGEIVAARGALQLARQQLGVLS